MGLFQDAFSFTPAGAITGANPADILTGGAVSNAKSVSETNDAQIALAQRQQDFQAQMSNTAYTRAVNDMRNAGLNPALAYNNGGASTPSGSMAQLQAPRTGDIGAGLASTAKSAATMIPDIQKTQSETKLNTANQSVAEASSQKLTANAKESEQNTELAKAQVEKTREDTKKARAEAFMASQKAAVSSARQKADVTGSKYFDPYIERAKKVSDIVKDFIP